METHRTVVVALTLLSMAVPGRARAQQTASVSPAPQPRAVVLSASGGISKGAYQGGVDWTLSEFLRRQRVPAFHTRLKARRPLDPLELGAATGASAGNINALFAALAWCTDRLEGGNEAIAGVKGIDAEESLFWKAWVNTGVHEILPADREKQRVMEPAALDREFFFRVHKAALDEFRNRAIPIGPCNLPVGLTLTRIDPVDVALDGGDNGTASVQRFATVFRVAAEADDKKVMRLTFAAPDDRHRNAKSLGALAILPALYGPPLAWAPRRDVVFEAVLASSSFPVAFAPRRLTYFAGGLKPAKDDPGAHDADFADGGLFDNNPIGLAAGLHELTLDEHRRGTRAEGPAPWVFYSSPDSLRGADGPAASPSSKGTRTGIRAAMDLISHAVASGRQYELQLFARQHARDEEDLGFKGVPELRQSSRALPIVGGMLGSFGAFLGRPFRERDFYLGIYDGLHFIARHVLCEGKSGPALENCIAAEHQRLITENVFQVSPMAQKALSWFVQQEYVGSSPEAAANTPHHEGLLTQINHHLFAVSRKPPAACGGGDPIARTLCADGFGELLDRMKRDKAILAASVALGQTCVGEVTHTGECVVDAEFQGLVRSPRRKVFRVVRRALDNLERAESRAGNLGRSGLAQAGQTVFRAATYRYRDPVEIMMSSGRSWDSEGWRGHVASIVGHAAPSYLQWNGISHREDSFVAGWRPLTFLVADKLFVGTQVEVSLRDLPDRSRNVWGGGVSIGTFGMSGFAAVEAGITRLPRSVAERFSPPSTWDDGRPRRWAGRLAIRMLADKIQVTTLVGPKAFSFGLGLNDINGMLYWWVR